MANDIQKQAVDTTIYTNLNNAIKAATHNPLLKQLIQVLGQNQFKGKAEVNTDPSTAQLDTNFFYLAEPGTYPNLGNITVDIGEVGFISYSEGVWEKSAWSASGGGNTFSDQFKSILDVIYFDAPYISAKYRSGISAKLFEANCVTAGSGLDRLGVLNLEFAPQTNKNLRLECEMRVTNNVGLNQDEISGYSIYEPVGGGTLVDRESLETITLTNSFQQISIPLFADTPTTPPDYEVNNYNLGLSKNGGGLNVGIGTVVEIRYVQILDELDNVIQLTNFTESANWDITDTDLEVLSGTRVQHLIFENAGEQPTVPSDNNLRPGDIGWLDTDIMEGEIAFNLPDQSVFWRSGNNILTFGGGEVVSIEKNPYTNTIEIANLFQHSPNYTPTPGTTLNIIKGASSTVINGRYIVKMILDNNTLNHGANFDAIGDYASLTGIYILRYTLGGDGMILVEIFNTTQAVITTPTVTTQAVTDITETTATGNGNVTDDGGATVTDRGIVWSENPNPTLSDSSASGGTGTGVFTAPITGLVSGTTYYSRAYATNSEGTSYGVDEQFQAASAAPIQLLSSLSLDSEGTPTGMVDSVSGNNAVYKVAQSFIGSGGQNASQVFYPSLVDLYTGNNTVGFISYLEDNDIINTNEVQWSFRDQTSQYVQLSKVAGGNKYSVSFGDDAGSTQLLSSNSTYGGGFIKVEFRISNIQTSTLTLGLYINDVLDASTTYAKGTILSSTIFTIGNFTRIAQGIGANGSVSGQFDLQIITDGIKFGRYPMAEGKYNIDGDIMYDTVGGNHAVLINAGANLATQNDFFYNQKGHLPKLGVKVPINEAGTAFADGTALTDPAAILNDGSQMLTPVILQQPQVLDLIINDVDEIYYTAGIAKQTTIAEIESAIIANPTVYQADVVTGEKLKNIALFETPFTADTAVMSFIFDDRSSTDPTVKAIFDEFGLKPNFAIMTQGLSGVNAPFYKTCYDEGCSILAHGILSTNKLDGTAILTDEQVREEIQDCKPIIESYGIGVSGFVTPFSVMDAQYLHNLDGHYDYAFTRNNGGLWGDTVDPHNLDRYSMEANIDLEDHNINVIKTRIDTAITNNELLTIYGHQMPSLYLDNYGQPAVNEDDLRAILTYCMSKIQARQLRVMSSDAAYEFYYGV